LGSSTGTVTFSSIPSTYTDLVLIFTGTTTSSNNEFIQFNSDTGTNYSDTWVAGFGPGASPNPDSGRHSNATGSYTGNNTTAQAIKIINIFNYANTTTYKTAITRWSSGSGSDYNAAAMALVSLWRSTAAINSIALYRAAGTYNSGSTFTLYGIKAA